MVFVLHFISYVCACVYVCVCVCVCVYTYTHAPGEGHGNPLQYSCLHTYIYLLPLEPPPTITSSTPLGHQRVPGWDPVLYSSFLLDVYFTHKKYGILHRFICHPCSGAMLSYSVLLQF